MPASSHNREEQPRDDAGAVAQRSPAAASPDRAPGGIETPEGFDPFELATVLSHYDLGVIDAIHAFPRGSPTSPKALIRSERGRFLLKRRSEGASSLERILFTHRVQLQLAERAFPLPRLLGTRHTNSSVLEWRGGLYEVYVFVQGVPFVASAAHAHAAGAALANLHAALADFDTSSAPRLLRGYHARSDLPSQLGVIPDRVSSVQPDAPAVARTTLAGAVSNLRDAYTLACENADRANASQWPAQVIHGDWHPGNLLFTKQNGVAAALDYDAARIEPRAFDLANGALQFSITRGESDPDNWPASPDYSRLRVFVRGYDGDEPHRISEAELAALPWLMIEALIVEAVAPVAATGSFARMEGGAFIRMVERKVRWLQENANSLQRILDSP